MGKARNWKTSKTLGVTLLCGLGHVGSSIVLGAIGIILGIGVKRLEGIESFRGNIAAWVFIVFGLGYFIWGMWKAHKAGIHKHLHLHHNGSLHFHEHQHTLIASHNHPHVSNKPVNLTPWILFTIFVLGPCEPLIPLLMYPAAEIHAGAVAMVAGIFSVVTILTMIGIVILTIRGINFLPMKTFEKYMHAIAGAAICLSGCAIIFLGL
jgi:sulfite exporter TauE/SafE